MMKAEDESWIRYEDTNTGICAERLVQNGQYIYSAAQSMRGTDFRGKNDLKRLPDPQSHFNVLKRRHDKKKNKTKK